MVIEQNSLLLPDASATVLATWELSELLQFQKIKSNLTKWSKIQILPSETSKESKTRHYLAFKQLYVPL